MTNKNQLNLPLLNKKKIIFIEGVSPKGHVNINKFYFNYLDNKIHSCYIGNSLHNNYFSIKKIFFFNDNNIFKKRLLSAAGFAINSCKLIYKTRNTNVKTICLLSYDPSSLFVVVYFSKLVGVNLYVFEHNTVPIHRGIKSTLQYICFNGVKRICYTPKAVEIYKKLGQEAIYIPHPMLLDKNKLKLVDEFIQEILDKKKSYKYTVFCPSSTTLIDRILLKAKNNKDVLFIIKTKEKILLDNVISKPYFENYNTLIDVADFFYLPNNLIGRVSGPFFEAIAAGKKIILQKGAFYEYATDYFESYILNDEDDWEFTTLVKNKINVENYNINIINDLSEYILEGK